RGLDLFDGLLAQILHVLEVTLAFLDEVHDQVDVGVLERVDRPRGQCQLLERLGERLAQEGLAAHPLGVRGLLWRTGGERREVLLEVRRRADRKSTRLNSSHDQISYAV